MTHVGIEPRGIDSIRQLWCLGYAASEQMSNIRLCFPCRRCVVEQVSLFYRCPGRRWRSERRRGGRGQEEGHDDEGGDHRAAAPAWAVAVAARYRTGCGGNVPVVPVVFAFGTVDDVKRPILDLGLAKVRDRQIESIKKCCDSVHCSRCLWRCSLLLRGPDCWCCM